MGNAIEVQVPLGIEPRGKPQQQQRVDHYEPVTDAAFPARNGTPALLLRCDHEHHCRKHNEHQQHDSQEIGKRHRLQSAGYRS